MTTNDIPPHPAGEPEQPGQLFSEVFDLIDEAVEAVTDAEIDDRLRQLLADAGSAAPPDFDDSTMPDEASLPAHIAGLARRQHRMLRHRDASAGLARIRQHIAAVLDLMPQHADASAERPGPVGGSRGRSVVRAATVLFAALSTVAVLLAVRLGDKTDSPGNHTVSPSTTAGQSRTTPRDPDGIGPGPGETLLTGVTAEKVTAAAQAAVPGGTIIRVEMDSAGSPYEAYVRKSDGTEVILKIDSSFKVTSTESPGPRP